jgi:hypothetical protein
MLVVTSAVPQAMKLSMPPEPTKQSDYLKTQPGYKSMIIWQDKLKARIKRKGAHCVKRGQSKLKLKSGFFSDCGDVPVAIITDDGSLVSVVNTRVNAYAYRNALRYRKRNKLRAPTKKEY